MLLTRLDDDELCELRQEYAAQLRLVDDEMTRRGVVFDVVAMKRRAELRAAATARAEICAMCGGRGADEPCEACGR